MKTKKTLLALALVTTLGMTLASCDDTTTSSSSGSGTASSSSSLISSTTGDEVTRIQVKYVNEVFYSGDVINLDDYVTLYNGGTALELKDYEATLSVTAPATLVGHTLTITGEGRSIVNITRGNLSASLTFESYSRTKGMFVDFIGQLGRNYVVEGMPYTPSELGQALISSGATYLIEAAVNAPAENECEYIIPSYFTPSATFIHNQNYFAYYQGIFQGGDDSYTGLYSGTDGNTYNMNFKDKGGSELEVLQGPSGAPFELYYVAMDFPITASQVTTQYDDSGNEYLLLSASATESFMQYSLGISYGYPSYYATITMEKTAYLPVGLTDEQALVTGEDGYSIPWIYQDLPHVLLWGVDPTGQAEPLDTWVIEGGNTTIDGVERNISAMPSIEDYRGETGFPEPLTDVHGFDKVLSTAEDRKNYTVDVVSTWFTEYDENNMPILPENSTEANEIFTEISSNPELGGNTSIDGGIHYAHIRNYYTEAGIGSEVVDTDSSNEVIKKGDSIYYNIQDNELVTVTKQAGDEEASQTSEEVTGDLFSEVDNLKGASTATNSLILSTSTHDEVTGAGSLSAITPSAASLLEVMLKTIYHYTAYDFYTADLQMTDGTTTKWSNEFNLDMYDNGEGEIKMLFSLTWTTGAYFALQFTISDIGTTEIPSNIPTTGVEAPAVTTPEGGEEGGDSTTTA